MASEKEHKKSDETAYFKLFCKVSLILSYKEVSVSSVGLHLCNQLIER